MTPLARARAYVVGVTVALVGVFGSPALFETGERYFPLSDYPMFAARRPAVETLPCAEVVRPDGTTERVDHRVLTDGGVSTARGQLDALARKPGPARDGFCAAIAAKLTGEGKLRIVRGLFSLERLRRERRAEPDKRTLIVTCPVSG